MYIEKTYIVMKKKNNNSISDSGVLCTHVYLVMSDRYLPYR